MNEYKIKYVCVCPLEDIFYGIINIKTDYEAQAALKKSKNYIQDFYKNQNFSYKCNLNILNRRKLLKKQKQKIILKKNRLPISLFYK